MMDSFVWQVMQLVEAQLEEDIIAEMMAKIKIPWVVIFLII